MKASLQKSFTFAALVDFSQLSSPRSQLRNAKRYGVRIIEHNNLDPGDWHVIEGPFWRFRCRASSLLFGHDDKDEFFIRKVEVTSTSNIHLYYYDLKSGKNAVIEIKRKPGLCMTFCSGRNRSTRRYIYLRCTRDNILRIIDFGQIIDIA